MLDESGKITQAARAMAWLRSGSPGRRVHGARRALGLYELTALRMVAGLEEISERARIGDRVVNQLAPRDQDIAMVFQATRSTRT